MITFFVDMQDDNNSLNGKIIQDSNDVAAVFAEMENREPSLCRLDAENGYTLTMGISKTVGCAQINKTNGDSPYLMAVTEERDWNGEDFEFLTADTPTPILRKYCLPISEIRRIACHFVNKGNSLDSITWEEV